MQKLEEPKQGCVCSIEVTLTDGLGRPENLGHTPVPTAQRNRRLENCQGRQNQIGLRTAEARAFPPGRLFSPN